MPLKTKTPSALSQTSPQPPSLSEERILRVNPEIDRRLDAFMQANDKMTEYYAKLVKENPDRAVRAFMLTKMFKHEAQLRVTERQAPQAKEWLDQQEPSIKQRIMDRLQKINPFYREKALVREIAREKTRIDFTPKQSVGQGMSV
jgi:ribosomal protein L13E